MVIRDADSPAGISAGLSSGGAVLAAATGTGTGGSVSAADRLSPLSGGATHIQHSPSNHNLSQIFESVAHELIALMSADTYNRFKLSQFFVRYLNGVPLTDKELYGGNKGLSVGTAGGSASSLDHGRSVRRSHNNSGGGAGGGGVVRIGIAHSHIAAAGGAGGGGSPNGTPKVVPRRRGVSANDPEPNTPGTPSSARQLHTKEAPAATATTTQPLLPPAAGLSSPGAAGSGSGGVDRKVSRFMRPSKTAIELSAAIEKAGVAGGTPAPSNPVAAAAGSSPAIGSTAATATTVATGGSVGASGSLFTVSAPVTASQSQAAGGGGGGDTGAGDVQNIAIPIPAPSPTGSGPAAHAF